MSSGLRAVVRRGLVPAVVVAGLLGGCSTGGTGAVAATVNGERIRVQDVQVATRDLAGLTNGASQSDVLMAMIVAPFYVQAAQDNGVDVSTQTARATLDSLNQQSGAAPVAASPGALAIVQLSLAEAGLQRTAGYADVSAGIADQIRAADLQVNPRFGVFDPAQLVIAPSSHPWLAVAQ